jgi:hypothetical protein
MKPWMAIAITIPSSALAGWCVFCYVSAVALSILGAL